MILVHYQSEWRIKIIVIYVNTKYEKLNNHRVCSPQLEIFDRYYQTLLPVGPTRTNVACGASTTPRKLYDRHTNDVTYHLKLQSIVDQYKIMRIYLHFEVLRYVTQQSKCLASRILQRSQQEHRATSENNGIKVLQLILIMHFLTLQFTIKTATSFMIFVNM